MVVPVVKFDGLPATHRSVCLDQRSLHAHRVFVHHELEHVPLARTGFSEKSLRRSLNRWLETVIPVATQKRLNIALLAAVPGTVEPWEKAEDHDIQNGDAVKACCLARPGTAFCLAVTSSYR